MNNKQSSLRAVKDELKFQICNTQKNTEISKQAQDDPEHLYLVTVNHNDHINGVVKEWIAPLDCSIPIPYTEAVFMVSEGQRLAVLRSLPNDGSVTLIKKYKREK